MENKRMIIAIVLSMAVLMAFQMLSPKKQQKPVIREQFDTASTVTSEGVPDTGIMPVAPGSAGAALKSEETIDIDEQEAVIETERFSLIFSNAGGSLKEIFLKDFEDEDGQPELLVSMEAPSRRLFAMTSSSDPALQKTAFTERKTPGMIEYGLTTASGLQITKRYTVHNQFNYIILDVFIKNTAPVVRNFSYDLTGPTGLGTKDQIAGRRFLEADTMIDGKIWKEKSVKTAVQRTGNISWTALKDRYFALILKPFSAPRAVTLYPAGNKELMAAFNSRMYEIGPGETIENRYLLYAGPLNEKEITAVSEDMAGIVDYGFFGGVSKVLLKILRTFHRITRSWGLAIILLTVTINIILLPLTMKSFSSMQQMKQVQPHIQKLKELHKDNPQKLNKETMELYKKYNVNPLGGCLPMLLQMPIFISLYQGLMRSVELKGSAFLWIKDLSKPDAVPLPWTLPVLGASVNILPLLMVGMMLVQQKATQGSSAAAMTDEQANQQKMMMFMFPLFFGFLFYKMPSGLVLYWLTNTILMTSEQFMMNRRMTGRG